MQRAALAIALTALVCCAVPTPGPFAAIGLALAALGLGWVGYGQRVPGGLRLAAAAAITLGGVALLLGSLRVVLVLAAIDHLYRVT